MKKEMRSNLAIKKVYHEPVLLSEVVSTLHIKSPLGGKKARYIDATVGAGGHSFELIKLGGEVLGIDSDREMLKLAEERLSGGSHKLVYGNFRDIDRIARDNGFEKVDGIILDLGISSYHLERQKRGFSFVYKEEPLDMRLDPETQNVDAAGLLNTLREDQLESLFRVTMDRKSSRILSRKVVERRKKKPFLKVGDFLEVTGGLRTKKGLNPATLPFLALRIAVNSELENLQEALPKALSLLEPAGRLVIISFHSGEDRIVKNFFREKETQGVGTAINKKPLVSTKEEIFKNPRSRSAKMRIFEKW